MFKYLINNGCYAFDHIIKSDTVNIYHSRRIVEFLISTHGVRQNR
eukprot:UN05641